MVTVGAGATVSGAATIVPLVMAGLVGPKPVPKMVMVSPGAAGVLAPAYSVVAPTMAPLLWTAATDALSFNRKNAGEKAFIVAVVDALTRPLSVTTIGTVPVAVSTGVSTSICLGL